MSNSAQPLLEQRPSLTRQASLLSGMLKAPDKQIILIRHGHSTFNAWREDQLSMVTIVVVSSLLFLIVGKNVSLIVFASVLFVFLLSKRLKKDAVRRWASTCSKWMEQDSPLSDKGRQQVIELREELCTFHEKLLQGVELVVVSPLTRALDTALAAFPRDNSNASGKPPKLLAQPLAAECLDTACDIGRPRSELEREYPDVDFSLLPEHWWYGGAENYPNLGHPHCKEPLESLKARIKQLRQWLLDRGENCIVVVGHSAFFKEMIGSRLKLRNCGIMQFDLETNPTHCDKKDRVRMP